MSTNLSRLLLREAYEESEWLGFRNINKWIEKLWKPTIIGMYLGKYEGEWKDGQMHGMGTLRIYRIIRGYLFGWKLLNEGKYVGKWKDGKQNGQGTYTWSDGSKFVGEYEDGVRNGLGTKTWSNGDEYQGQWKNSRINGQGTYTWSDGNKYVGSWKDDKPWNGIKYNKNRNILGKFVNGKPIKQ